MLASFPVKLVKTIFLKTKVFGNCPNRQMAYEDTSTENYLWKLGNKRESMWYLNQDHSLSLSSTPAQWGRDSPPDWCHREHRVPSLPRTQMEGFLSGRGRMSAFSSCSKCLVAETRSQVSATEKQGLLSCTQPPMYNGGSTLTWLLFLWFMRPWIHTRRGKLREPQASAPFSLEEFLVPRMEVTLKRYLTVSLPSDPWCRDFCLGREAGHKAESSSSLSMELPSFASLSEEIQA